MGEGPERLNGAPGAGRLSPPALRAWKLAAFEADRARAGFIKREHLFLALLDPDAVLPGEAPGRNHAAAGEDPGLLLAQAGPAPRLLCQCIRSVLGKGTAVRTGTIIHRDPACRHCFERAAVLAGGNEATCLHLFAAILEDPGPVIPGCLGQQDTSCERVRALCREPAQPAAGGKKETEERELLACELASSRQTLNRFSGTPGQLRALQREIRIKTISLARICLEINDLPGLTGALQDLAGTAGRHREELAGIIAQLEFLRCEEIRIGTQSAGRVRDLLQALEAGGGAP